MTDHGDPEDGDLVEAAPACDVPSAVAEECHPVWHLIRDALRGRGQIGDY